MPRSKFQAPRTIESFADVQRALRQLQESLDASSRSPYQLGIQTHDFTPISPSFQRVSPGPLGVKAVLPAAGPENASQSVVFCVEKPNGLLTVFAAPGDTVNGATAQSFSVAGIVELFSNGDNAWNSVAQLPGPAGTPGTTGAPSVVTPPGFSFPVDEDGPAWLVGPPGLQGVTGAQGQIGPGFEFPVDDDGPWAFPPVPFGWAPVLSAGNRSGSNNAFMDVGQFVNFGLDGPTANNPQIRSGDATFRVRGSGNVFVIGEGVTAGLANVAVSGFALVQASGAGGTAELQSTAGPVVIDANTIASVTTGGAQRWAVDATGAWALAGVAGASGQVPTSTGPGGNMVWSTPSGGAAATPQPPGLAFPVDEDGPPWLAIPGPQGLAGSAGAPGATGAQGPTALGLPFAVDADELQPGMPPLVAGIESVLAAGSRANTRQFIEFGQPTFALGPPYIQSETLLSIRSGTGNLAFTSQAGGMTFSPVGIPIQVFAGAAGMNALEMGNCTTPTIGTGGFGAGGTGAYHVTRAASEPSRARFQGCTSAGAATGIDAYMDCTAQSNKQAASSLTNSNAVLDCTGSVSIPANTLIIGSQWRVEFTFQFARGATATALNISSFMSLGANSITVVGAATTVNGETGRARVVAEFTVLSTGAGGTCMATLSQWDTFNTALPFRYSNTSNLALAVNTTIANAFVGTAQMGTAVVATTLTATGGSAIRVF